MRFFLATAASICALIAVAIGTQFAAAHHSATMFDHAKTMTIQVIEGLKAIGSGPNNTFMIPIEFTRLLGPAHLNLARLDAAAHLLRQESARSVTNIALDCGFNTSQYFANQFRSQHIALEELSDEEDDQYSDDRCVFGPELGDRDAHGEHQSGQ